VKRVGFLDSIHKERKNGGKSEGRGVQGGERIGKHIEHLHRMQVKMKMQMYHMENYEGEDMRFVVRNPRREGNRE